MGRKLTKPAAFLAIVLLTWLFSPAESTLAGEKCKAIKANQAAAINATGTGTTGTVTNNGLLKGTTQFTFTSPLTPVANAPGTFSYTGVLTLTTDKGTLTTGDVGIFDVAQGVFTDIGTVTGGTGTFAGATGTLFFTGKTGDGVHFDDEISGQLCLAREG